MKEEGRVWRGRADRTALRASGVRRNKRGLMDMAEDEKTRRGRGVWCRHAPSSSLGDSPG